eukprot:1452876-Pyramimonas_sp.AAC.1
MSPAKDVMLTFQDVALDPKGHALHIQPELRSTDINLACSKCGLYRGSNSKGVRGMCGHEATRRSNSVGSAL